ncbi:MULTISPECIES: extracellular solute-binding protein [unclassified Actinotalea]|uniref:extracellular solute-binding protein n=1 Tax=unclassified Actinotalea TaxID=2638618 RepID=UPI0015F3A6E4|nr:MULTISPECIES: extracellular solute-binding protein [unclassified Actinotalea]
MKTARRGAAGAASVAALALVLGACGGGGDGDGGGTTDEGSSEASFDRPITWMSILHTPTTPDAEGPIQVALEEHTGVEFEIQWVPDASKDEKLNAALASNTLSDLTTLTQVDSSTVRNALSSGMFWDVEEYLEEFPNLSEIDPKTLEAARIDGGLYGVPFQKPLARYGVLVRQDWLDNLGLETPHTVEELGEVARAFTEDDPDGNGAADTVGFIERAESFQLSFRVLAGYFGAGDKFVVDDDDTVVPAFTTDEFKTAMEWYREVYENGHMNQEFVTTQKQNQQDAIAQGKGGIVITGLMEARNYMNLARSANPETPMAWALVNDMTWGDVPRRVVSDTNGGMGGWLAISKENIKTEDELRHVLGFIDSLLDEEAFDLMTNGIEGTHYELDADGVLTILDQGVWQQEVQPYAGSRPSDLVATYKVSDPYQNLSNELIPLNAEFAVTNPAQPLTSETYDAQWSAINQSIADAFNRYVMGDIDMDGYEDAIESARGQGLDAVIEEFTASYAEVNG